MGITAHERHDAQRLAQGLGFFVRAVGGRQRFENIGNRHHPRRQAHVVALQAFGVAGAVHFFVVAASNLRHVAQMLGEGQVAEHQDRLHDMVVDDVALFAGQGAAGNAQVIEFAAVVLVARYIEFEAPGIVRRNQLGFGAFQQMLGLVRQQ
ncbi:hypothetical protein D3C87_1384900 [compost metagenome]